MPKITAYGGATNAGLTERDGGFVDNVRPARAISDPTGDGYDDDGQALGGEPVTELGDGGDDSGQVEQTGLVAGGDDAPAKNEPPFDPSDLSVSEVQGLLAECTGEEKAAVIAAEKANKNRKGITGE